MKSTTRLLLFVISLITLSSFQEKHEQEIQSSLIENNLQYQNKNKSKKEFLDAADSIIQSSLRLGLKLNNTELIHNLKLYKEIAWNNDELKEYRIHYYINLLNTNSNVNNRGASIYYAEKVKNESQNLGSNRLLIDQIEKTVIFSYQKNYNDVVEIYNNNKSLLEKTKEDLTQNRKPTVHPTDVLKLLSYSATAFKNINDTLKTIEVIELGKEIGNLFLKDENLAERTKYLSEFYIYEMEYNLGLVQKDANKSQNALYNMENLYNKYPSSSKGILDINLINYKIAFFLEEKEIDSIEFYISKFELVTDARKEKIKNLYNYKSKLYEIKGDYEKAYEFNNQSLKITDEINSQIVKEMDDLLYSFTEAEEAKLFAEIAEEEKNSSRIKYTLIITALILIIGISSILLYRREKKIKLKTQTLDMEVKFHINQLKEIKNETIKSEQKRIGKELHDSLSARIASLNHQLELIKLEEGPIDLKSDITPIQNQIKDIYNTVRDKSHLFLDSEFNFGNENFANSIREITQTALPEKYYDLKIEVDDENTRFIPNQVKVEIYKIIQEAITNIIKHSKAKKVEILLFQELNELKLIVIDNGYSNSLATLFSKNKLGHGLKNIKERAESLFGEFSMKSTPNNGTELLVTIPVKWNNPFFQS